MGNPPFLAQRTRDTARDEAGRDAIRHRFGTLGPYVDAAASFLLVAVELLGPEGVAVMIQPQSVLAARDAATVRDRVLLDAALVSLWADDGRHFDAAVDVCAPVLRRTSGDAGPARVELRWGPTASDGGDAPVPAHGESWAPLLATGLGVPAARIEASRRGGSAAGADAAATIGDVAHVTAGFRDEFYALASSARCRGDEGWSAGASPLVTVGMLDVATMDRRSPRRLGGRTVVDPRLDRRALRRRAPRVAEWVGARSVPKVMVATQTRIPEAVADPTGRFVPVTPVVSVEPGGAAVVDVWDLLAVISSPPVAAHLVRSAAGSGLSVRSVRISAASLRSVPLPGDRRAWSHGATLIRDLQQRPTRARVERFRAFGEVMCDAYAVERAEELVGWWSDRLVPA
ncbi:MAG: hypothetical protein JST64_03015 [Actinobacteria bacterium]|nr:hypothetical protein [Actinomycetota bacterium]